MVKSIRKVYFLHPTGHNLRKNFSGPPLEKILGAPLPPHYKSMGNSNASNTIRSVQIFQNHAQLGYR